MAARVLHPPPQGSAAQARPGRVRANGRAAAMLAVGGLLAACAASEHRAGASPAVLPSSSPVQEKATPVINAPTALLESALADAARRTKVPREEIEVVSAEAVTWPDGSMGCPQPGMMYTQALVPGYRIVLQAGESLFAYHASRSGPARFCPADRAQPPPPPSDGT